jgi:acetylornithine deacetylase/succinyl-diaminopimelate desuccinylase-like protein
VYVDIRTPPDSLPITAQREFLAALDAVGVTYRCQFYLSQRGYQGRDVEPLVEACRRAHELVAGVPPEPIASVETSMWTDTNMYHEAGIPAVKFGIGGPHAEPDDFTAAEYLHRQINATSAADLVKAAKIYIATAAEVCTGSA